MALVSLQVQVKSVASVEEHELLVGHGLVLQAFGRH